MGDLKTKCVLLAAVMMAGISVGAPAASAAVFIEPVHSPLRAEPVHGETNALCSIVSAAVFSPGVSLASRTSTVDATGTIACTGTFYGHRVTAPGTVGIKGTLTGTCLVSHLTAWFSATIPTDAGPMRLAGPLEQDNAFLAAVFVAYLSGARLTGFEVGQPLAGKDLVPGTCVTPVMNALGERIAFATDQKD